MKSGTKWLLIGGVGAVIAWFLLGKPHSIQAAEAGIHNLLGGGAHANYAHGGFHGGGGFGHGGGFHHGGFGRGFGGWRGLYGGYPGYAALAGLYGAYPGAVPPVPGLPGPAYPVFPGYGFGFRHHHRFF